MTRTKAGRWLFWSLALATLGAACDDTPAGATGSGSSPGSQSGTASQIPLPRLFPLSPGDRWRLEATPGDGLRLEGVTAIDGRGIIAVHGTGHGAAERYRITADEVTLVTPTGEAISPILRAPLVTGAEWSYAHRERDVEVPCEAEVVSAVVTETVAGVEVEGCISLRRRCNYPAGAPFTNSTTHSTEETYCPGVGLARMRNVFRPAPTKSALAADREERVVGFRVANSPAGGPPAGCARFILLPSDLVTVCGTDVRSAPPITGEELPGGACRYRYQHGTEPLTAVIGAPVDSAPADALVHVHEGDRRAWVSGRSAACVRAESLAPLLESLLR